MPTTMTLPDVETSPPANDNLVHIVCPDDINRSLCGLDVTNEPWQVASAENPGCPMCHLLDEAGDCAHCVGSAT